MKRWFLGGALVAAVITGVVIGARPFRQRLREAQSNTDKINADTADVMASATYQRYAARREEVFAMKAALREVAQIESSFVADSGRPITSLPPGGVRFDPNRIRITIWLLRDRWVATAGSYRFGNTMTCMITAMVDTVTDTVTWHYRAGAPRCAETSFDDSVYALMPPAPIAPPGPEPTPLPPARPEPHKHLDWGPVNNTPPRMPFIVRESCQGEGCTYRGGWAACSPVVARAAKRQDAAPVFTIKPGERFVALTADVHVDEAGIVVFRHPYTATIVVDEVGIVDVTFSPADTLFVLNYYGEGVVTWRFRGSTIRGDMFWDPEEPPTPTDTFALVRPAKTVWWVRVRNAAGQEGWIVGDYRLMATGGYMDEVERCLHPKNGDRD